MELKRSIGSKALFLLVMNAIIGTGIFFLPALSVKNAGASSIFSWIAMSGIAVMMSFVFAELISMKPESGGLYKIVKNSFGEFYGFIFGWLSWIVANITISMLIVGSFNYLFPGLSPPTAVIISLSAVLFFNYINYRGIGVSTKMLVVFGFLTIATLLVIIVPGVTITASTAVDFSALSFPVIFLTIFYIAETFFGWETATYLADETKNARKVLPRMIIITTVVISILSCLLVYVGIGLNQSAFVNSTSPLTTLFSLIYGNSFSFAFSLIIFIPLIGTAASWIIASPRLLYAMSKDKVLIRQFGNVHKKNKVPHNAIFFQTAAIGILTLIALGNFMTLLMLLVPLVMIMYTMITFAYIKTRNLGFCGSFRSPLGVKGAWLLVLINVLLIGSWLLNSTTAPYVLFMGLMLVFIGFPLYIIIKLYTDRIFVENIYNKLSVIWDPLFSLWYSDPESRFVVSKLSLNKESKVLDFGCGTGKTTKHIAKKASVVVGIDISEKQLKKAMKIMRKENLNNVIFMKDYKSRFKKGSFDALTAVGVLEHLENPKSSLKNLLSMLKKDGSFSMLCFGKSFGFVGSPHFSSQEKIRELFSDMDIELSIKNVNKRFTQYWYIWGIKK